MAAFTLQPLGVARTRIVCELLFARDEVAREDFDPSDAAELWEITNRQDWTVCELVQRGMSSRAYVQGWYAPMEDESMAITRWLLPRLGQEVSMNTDQRSAVVVGAGIIGSSISLELARSGWDVTVVDKGSTPGCGSTSASSAMVRFNYDSLPEAALAWESAARWNDWEQHLGAVDPAGMAKFVRTGLLVLDGELLDRERSLTFMARLGIPYEALDAAEIRKRYPALDPAQLGPACRVEDDHFWDDPSGELGGFVQEDSGFVNDPTLAAHNFAHAAEQSGATFQVARRRLRVSSRGRPGRRCDAASGETHQRRRRRERRGAMVGEAQHHGGRARRLQHLDATR